MGGATGHHGQGHVPFAPLPLAGCGSGLWRGTPRQGMASLSGEAADREDVRDTPPLDRVALEPGSVTARPCGARGAACVLGALCSSSASQGEGWTRLCPPARGAGAAPHPARRHCPRPGCPVRGRSLSPCSPASEPAVWPRPATRPHRLSPPLLCGAVHSRRRARQERPRSPRTAHPLPNPSPSAGSISLPSPRNQRDFVTPPPADHKQGRQCGEQGSSGGAVTASAFAETRGPRGRPRRTYAQRGLYASNSPAAGRAAAGKVTFSLQASEPLKLSPARRRPAPV